MVDASPSPTKCVTLPPAGLMARSIISARNAFAADSERDYEGFARDACHGSAPADGIYTHQWDAIAICSSRRI